MSYGLAQLPSGPYGIPPGLWAAMQTWTAAERESFIRQWRAQQRGGADDEGAVSSSGTDSNVIRRRMLELYHAMSPAQQRRALQLYRSQRGAVPSSSGNDLPPYVSLPGPDPYIPGPEPAPVITTPPSGFPRTPPAIPWPPRGKPTPKRSPQTPAQPEPEPEGSLEGMPAWALPAIGVAALFYFFRK